MKVHLKVLGLVLAATCTIPLTVQGQDTTARVSTTFSNNYIMMLDPVEPGQINVSAGIAITMLPLPLVETEVPAPALDVRCRLGLSSEWSLVGRFVGNYAANVVSIAPMRTYELTALWAGYGAQVSYMFGRVDFLEGFNTSASGVFVNPFVALGLRIDDIALTAKYEFEMTLYKQHRVESISSTTSRNTFNGTMLSFYVEQPFWRMTSISLGVTLHYTRNPYQAWLAFNTFSDALFYPELQMGVLF
jgi:hypothetical protein